MAHRLKWVLAQGLIALAVRSYFGSAEGAVPYVLPRNHGGILVGIHRYVDAGLISLLLALYCLAYVSFAAFLLTGVVDVTIT